MRSLVTMLRRVPSTMRATATPSIERRNECSGEVAHRKRSMGIDPKKMKAVVTKRDFTTIPLFSVGRIPSFSRARYCIQYALFFCSIAVTVFESSSENPRSFSICTVFCAVFFGFVFSCCCSFCTVVVYSFFSDLRERKLPNPMDIPSAQRLATENSSTTPTERAMVVSSDTCAPENPDITAKVVMIPSTPP